MRGYTFPHQNVEPTSIADTAANQTEGQDLAYAQTPDGENSLPLNLSKPGVAASIAIYARDEGAKAAAVPTPGATVEPRYSGNVAYIAWQGDPSKDIQACATTQ
jgi:hypothetical protein